VADRSAATEIVAGGENLIRVENNMNCFACNVNPQPSGERFEPGPCDVR
jgi:hypothetical protein